MATDTDHRAYCGHLRHPSSFSSDPQYEIQDVSISELVNHGSISFGRFAAETLDWEKRSVFSNNRYQDELEKFKAPGIVAQKKAYFEEYYRKIRAAKKSQTEEQEISQPDPCEDKLSCTSQAQNTAEICNSNDVKNSDSTSQITVLVEKMNEQQHIAPESNKGNSLVTGKQKVNFKDDVVKKVQQSNNTLDSSGLKCLKKAVKFPASSQKTCYTSSLPNKVVSVSLNAKKLKARTLLSEVKGPVPLAKEETMLNNMARRNAAKLPEKGNPLSGGDGSVNGSRRLVMAEKTSHLLQRSVKCKNLAVHKSSSRVQSSTEVSQPAVSRHIPTTCLNTKINSDKSNLNFGSRSKSSSRHANVTSKVNNMSRERSSARIAGKTSESSSRGMTWRSGQSENQKPKIISINRQTETNPNIRVGTQIKVTRAVDGRVPKTATTTPCNANKATSSTAEKKVMARTNFQLGAPTSGRREQRNKLPSWR
ncbi:protein WVD2-like 7 isoform X2 [Daucus carota subsp. sativus]|uniref:protein WVD2-like 7 isoform X2 n=1 Tax=Daucus carota subsp. sativus TaxID=79200 RepID=UPI0007F0370B|nr:PREDICTED: protein WVD2-like 7 isoform X2 [Daucus carota subsp. sativus]